MSVIGIIWITLLIGLLSFIVYAMGPLLIWFLIDYIYTLVKKKDIDGEDLMFYCMLTTASLASVITTLILLKIWVPNFIF